MPKLTLDAKISVIAQAVDDYQFYQEQGAGCPAHQTFKIISRDEDLDIVRSARTAALKQLNSKPIKKTAADLAIINGEKELFADMLEREHIRPGNGSVVQPHSGQCKVAFDTRRIDQEKERNPRHTLQYWHRSDPFVDEDDEKKLRVFARLMKVMKNIKDDFGTEPEWFESYSRILYDAVYRTLNIKQADVEVFRPQFNYMEQLINARYHLTMFDLETKPEKELRGIVLSKDEGLLKRGEYRSQTGINKTDEKQLVIDSNNSGKSTQEALINAIFGKDNLRKDGERTVERTITITIRDNVVE